MGAGCSAPPSAAAAAQPGRAGRPNRCLARALTLSAAPPLPHTACRSWEALPSIPHVQQVVVLGWDGFFAVAKDPSSNNTVIMQCALPAPAPAPHRPRPTWPLPAACMRLAAAAAAAAANPRPSCRRIWLLRSGHPNSPHPALPQL